MIIYLSIHWNFFGDNFLTILADAMNRFEGVFIPLLKTAVGMALLFHIANSCSCSPRGAVSQNLYIF
jgi:hypothetical protein